MPYAAELWLIKHLNATLSRASFLCAAPFLLPWVPSWELFLIS